MEVQGQLSALSDDRSLRQNQDSNPDGTCVHPNGTNPNTDPWKSLTYLQKSLYLKYTTKFWLEDGHSFESIFPVNMTLLLISSTKKNQTQTSKHKKNELKTPKKK